MIKKNHKLELWKQMLQSRQEEDQTERNRLQQELEPNPSKLLPDTHPGSIINAIPPPAPKTDQVSMSQRPAEATVNPFQAALCRLEEKMDVLQLQMSEIKRYVKRWIKQERILRNKSAIVIQSWFRGWLIRWAVRRMTRRRQQTARVDFGINVSTHQIEAKDSNDLDLYAVRIQSIVRGWKTRKILRLIRCAVAIQRCWRSKSRVERSRIDVESSVLLRRKVLDSLVLLQRVQRTQKIQEKAMSELWSEIKVLGRGQKVDDLGGKLNEQKEEVVLADIDPTLVEYKKRTDSLRNGASKRIQRGWRNHLFRRKIIHPKHYLVQYLVRSEAKGSERQSTWRETDERSEFETLKQEVRELKEVVAALAERRTPNCE